MSLHLHTFASNSIIFMLTVPMDDLGDTAQMDYDEELRCPVCFLLLVDPTTLNCGHTMCKLCLARWYNVSKKKECTVCRQQWEGQPKVNTTIR